MTEYSHSEVPSSNVSNFDQFRSAHHPESDPSIPCPESGTQPDSVFAARLLDSWAQLPSEALVYERIIYDAADDERLSSLISDETLTSRGASLHFTGEAFATTVKGLTIDPDKIQALEIMYRTNFIYQRTQQPQPVWHPMVAVLFERIIEEG